MDKLVISCDAHDKIMHYVNKTDFEVSGLGVIEILDGQPTVTDVYLLEQENDPTETEITSESINKVLYEHYKTKKKGDIKFWWHSHVNMDVFWSGTDRATIKQLTQNGWFFHGVFNKKDEVKIAFSNCDPVFGMIDNLNLDIDYDLVNDQELYDAYQIVNKIKDERAKKWDEDYDELVTERCVKSYATSYADGYRTSYAGGYFWEEEDDLIGRELSDIPSSISKAFDRALYEDSEEIEENYPLEGFGFDNQELAYLSSIGVNTLDDYFEFENEYGNIDYILTKGVKSNA